MPTGFWVAPTVRSSYWRGFSILLQVNGAGAHFSSYVCGGADSEGDEAKVLDELSESHGFWSCCVLGYVSWSVRLALERCYCWMKF